MIVQQWKGQTLISLREYYEKDGKLLPTSKGKILASVSCLQLHRWNQWPTSLQCMLWTVCIWNTIPLCTAVSFVMVVQSCLMWHFCVEVHCNLTLGLPSYWSSLTLHTFAGISLTVEQFEILAKKIKDIEAAITSIQWCRHTFCLPEWYGELTFEIMVLPFKALGNTNWNLWLICLTPGERFWQ